MKGLLLSEWQKEVISSFMGVSPSELERLCQILGPAVRLDEGCNCPAIPWPDHRHRFIVAIPHVD